MKRRLAPLATALALWAAAAAASAQNAFIEAARAGASVAPPTAAADSLVRAFVDGCVAHGGDSMHTVDWAINEGWEWVDAFSGPGAALLSNRPGTVLSMPGSQQGVLLAIDLERRCTVWTERADGPVLRAAFVRALDTLASRGARVQPSIERSVERAGAWRMQLNRRVRLAGQTDELEVGSVTTLTPQPAAQVMSVAPAPAAAASAPTASR